MKTAIPCPGRRRRPPSSSGRSRSRARGLLLCGLAVAAGPDAGHAAPGGSPPPGAFLSSALLPAAPPTTSPPPAASAPCTAGPPPRQLGIPAWPPCIDVTLEGHDITGRPPLTFTWEISSGLTLSGNPAVLDTTLLAPGFHQAQLRVTNDTGSATSPAIYFVIESLAAGPAPSHENLGGRRVQFEAHAQGATAYHWSWGDGTQSGWLPGCDGALPVHTYPAAGTYSARLEVRNCRDGTRTSGPFPVLVTDEVELAILDFAADCPDGFCIFDSGQAIAFHHQLQGGPTTYAYDWDGDGLTDEIAGAPVPTHAYPLPGTYTPRLTVTRHLAVDSFAHALPLFIQPAPGGETLFADGFESGGTSAWSATSP